MVNQNFYNKNFKMIKQKNKNKKEQFIVTLKAPPPPLPKLENQSVPIVAIASTPPPSLQTATPLYPNLKHHHFFIKYKEIISTFFLDDVVVAFGWHKRVR